MENSNLDIYFAPELDRSQYTDTAPAIDDAYPRYVHYQGQHEPQDVRLILTQEGTVYVDYDPIIGSGTTSDLHHDIDLAWSGIPSETTGAEINEFLRDVTPLMERVHAGHSVEWDGSNQVGRLDDDATKASDEIDRAIADNFEWHEPKFEMYDPADFFEDGLSDLKADTTDDEINAIAKRETLEAWTSAVLFSDDAAEALTEIRDRLKEQAEEEA